MLSLSWVIRNRDEILVTALAWAFSKLPNRLVLLKRLELGVFFFCWREAIAAIESGDTKLGGILYAQAESEFHHAQSFAALTGGKLEISANGLFDREYKEAFKWSQVEWDSSESFRADGISRKYLSARIFFKGQTANSFMWQDKLAFMAILETFQAHFYKKLLRFLPPHEATPLISICGEEEDHSLELRSVLTERAGIFSAADLMLKWKRQLYLGLLFTPIDLIFANK